MVTPSPSNRTHTLLSTWPIGHKFCKVFCGCHRCREWNEYVGRTMKNNWSGRRRQQQKWLNELKRFNYSIQTVWQNSIFQFPITLAIFHRIRRNGVCQLSHIFSLLTCGIESLLVNERMFTEFSTFTWPNPTYTRIANRITVFGKFIRNSSEPSAVLAMIWSQEIRIFHPKMHSKERRFPENSSKIENFF